MRERAKDGRTKAQQIMGYPIAACDPVKAAPITAAEFQALIERKARRDAEIDPLMAKLGQARSLGFDLNEKDKKRLLALLLTDVIDGTMK